MNDITYMVTLPPSSPSELADHDQFSTLFAVFTLDKLGRRTSLYLGAIVMGIAMFLSGGLSRLAQEHPDKASKYGAAAASFTFVFTAGFGATWLTIPCKSEMLDELSYL